MPRNAGAFLGGASGGLTKLAAALAGGAGSQQDAYDQQMMAQTKLGQALAAMRASDANAAFDTARAGTETQKQGILGNRPDLYEEQAALAAGTDIPTLRAFRERTRTGQAPQVPMGPETETGQMGSGSAQFPPQLSTGLARSLQQFLPLLANSGDLNPDQMASAAESFRGMGLGDAILAGQMPAADVGRSQAAAGGKGLFSSDSTGTVLDIFSGGLNEGGGLAKSSIAENRAQAANALAQADKARSDGGRGNAPAGYRWTQAGALESIPGGPADPNTKGAKLAKPPNEGQSKALNFGSRMAIADETLSELATQGVEQSGSLKRFAEGTGNLLGLGTESAGGALSNLGGTATNWTQSPEQQRVEQAQRDFINAVLRRESGATIQPSEFDSAAKQYFPQSGDSDEVKAQKAINRQTAIMGMQAEFGEASRPEFERIVENARRMRTGGRKAAQPLTRTPMTGPGAAPAQAPAQRNIVVDW
jgi:hypothetical protein